MQSFARLLLLVHALCLWGSLGHGEPTKPPCRKSPEVHTIGMFAGGHRRDEVVAFGGKGYTWKKKKGRRLSAEEDDGELDEKELMEDDEEVLEALAANETMSSEAQALALRANGGLKAKVSFFSDVWVFSLGTNKWTKASFGHHPKPISRWKPASCGFDDDASMALFGGCHGTDVSGVLNDLWVLKVTSGGKGRWSQVATNNPPRARRGHITVANRTHLVVAGGKGWTQEWGTEVLRDLWMLPLESLRHASNGKMDASLRAKDSPVWTAGKPFPARARWGSTGDLLEMPDGKQVIAYFGGRNQNKGAAFHAVAESAYTYFNELWFYSFADDAWTMAQPKGKMPCPRDHHAAAAFGTDLYVFGGRTAELQSKKSTRGDLWSYSTKTGEWTLHAEGKTGPSPRFMPGLTIVPNGDQLRCVVFAGETLPGSTKRTSLNDVWAYDLDKTGKNGKEWKKVSSDECSAEAVMGFAELAEMAEPAPEAAAPYVLQLCLASVLSLAVPAGLVARALVRPSEIDAPLLDAEGETSEGYQVMG